MTNIKSEGEGIHNLKMRIKTISRDLMNVAEVSVKLKLCQTQREERERVDCKMNLELYQKKS